jgi:hypothetical protein
MSKATSGFSLWQTGINDVSNWERLPGDTTAERLCSKFLGIEDFARRDRAVILHSVSL